MKTIRNLILSALITLSSAVSFAGDASDSTILGFSKDGSHFAFMQTGVQDGSGFFWTQIDVIEVASNKLVKRVYEDSEKYLPIDEEITPAQEKQFIDMMKRRADLDRYGIDQAIKGNTVLNRPLTDFSSYNNTVFSVEYWAQGGASSMVKTYKLDIKESKAPVEKHNEWCQDDFYGSYMITVNLTTNHSLYDDQYTPNVTTLQKDTRVPASRACAWGYKPTQIINYKNALVVLVNYQTVGFEGPNYRFIAVTGQL